MQSFLLMDSDPLAQDIENPLDNVAPNVAILGDEVMLVVGILWGLCLLASVVFLAKGFVQYAAAKQQGMVERVGEAAKEVKQALIGVAGLVALPAIVALIIEVLG